MTDQRICSVMWFSLNYLGNLVNLNYVYSKLLFELLEQYTPGVSLSNYDKHV